MGLLCSLFFAFLLVRAYSIREIHGGVNEVKHPALRLPLYHVRGRSHSLHSLETPLSFQYTIAHDDVRVQFLNSRLTKKNLTSFHPVATSVLKGAQSLVDVKSVNVPLNPGQSIGVGNYYTRVGMGSPPTYHSVVVDTGSSLSWIQCEPCAIYCHPQVGSPFQPSASDTYQQLPCGSNQCSALKVATLNSAMCSVSDQCIYTATYGDQSYSVGYLSRDSLSIGSASVPGFVFGCGQGNEGLFGRSSGIFGLAKNELSLIFQLSSEYGKAFSYCLQTETGSGGFLSLGTTSNAAYTFTPMLSDSRDSSLYFVRFSAISVSGKPIAVPASAYNVPTIIDSGTVISRLPMPVYSALRDELVKIISSKFQMAAPISILDACFTGSSDEISTVVPPVQLSYLGGAEVSLKPYNVVVEVEKGTTCLAFAGNSNGNTIAIIGNRQQLTFDILYDVAGSKIGFAAGGCR